jgi:hypothetical protein
MIFRTFFIPTFTLCLAFLLSACTQPKTEGALVTPPTQLQVPFTVAERYFIKNEVEQVPLELKTQAEFDAIFGAAAVMGADGRPTPIDFEQQMVLALAEPESTVATRLEPISLEKNPSGELVLTYRVQRGATQSFTSRASLALLIPKSAAGPVILQQK